MECPLRREEGKKPKPTYKVRAKQVTSTDVATQEDLHRFLLSDSSDSEEESLVAIMKLQNGGSKTQRVLVYVQGYLLRVS